MICSKCRAENDDEYIFCVNCGTSLPGSGPKTEKIPEFVTVPAAAQPAASSVPNTLEFRNAPGSRSAQTVPHLADRGQIARPRRSSRTWIFFSIGGILVLIAAGVVVAVLIVVRPGLQSQLLPDHLGLFSVERDRKSLSEIRKFDVANLYDTSSSGFGAPLTVVAGKPEFILYAESAEIRVDDLKFIRLDSVTDAGSMKHFPFQASFIEGKRGMKTLKFQNGLPNGRYAFALFDGFLNEGRHKLWPFEVQGSNVSESATSAQEITVAVKPKDTPPANTESPSNTNSVSKPPATPEIPTGARVAYCNATDVVVRNNPRLTARKVNELSRGQKVFVISYSDNYDIWNGVEANWAYIQTESGKRGWVFTPFISY